MKKTTCTLALAILLGATLHARAASFAHSVLSYTPGTLPPGYGSYSNPAAALGKPAPIVGLGSTFDSVLSPFNAHYEATQLTGIGVGGQLTLQLQNFVLIDRTAGVPEIGVWENVGIMDTSYPSGVAGAPVSFFGQDSAIVEVSPDNVNWYSLNNGAPILFTMPGTYFLNSGAYDPTAPANPVEADFGKPFTGTTATFDGKTMAQIVAAFDGSAGGTWLDVNGAGSAVPANVTQIGYVRFSNPSNTDGFELDAVSINSSRMGSPVPEPGSGVLLALGLGGFAVQRRRRE